MSSPNQPIESGRCREDPRLRGALSGACMTRIVPSHTSPGPAGRETFRRAGGTVAVGNEPASRHTPFVMPSMLLYHKRGLEFQAAWKVGLVFGLCALQRPPPFPPGGSGPSPVGGSMPLWGNYDRSLLSVGGDSRLVIGPGQKHAKSPHTVGRIVTPERLTLPDTRTTSAN